MIQAKYLILIAISSFVIAFDQLTKMVILAKFQLFESVPVINNLFHITYVQNTGAAFGFLAESHASFREVFFLSMPPIALVIIFMMLRAVENSDRIQVTALSLIFGGAIGNYIDRLRFRYVVDFLDFSYRYTSDGQIKTLSWPAFNVADSAIVCGVSVLIYLMLVQKKDTLSV